MYFEIEKGNVICKRSLILVALSFRISLVPSLEYLSPHLIPKQNQMWSAEIVTVIRRRSPSQDTLAVKRDSPVIQWWVVNVNTKPSQKLSRNPESSQNIQVDQGRHHHERAFHS